MKDIDLLRRVPLFEGMNEAELAGLVGIARDRSLPKGSVVFLENDPGDALYVIREGTVKVYRVTQEGREKTLSVLFPGEVLGEMAVLDGGPRSAIAQTLAYVRLWVISKDDFHRLLLRHPEMALKVIATLSRRLRGANAQIEDALFRDVRGRLVRALAYLAEQVQPEGPGGLTRRLGLTHQELANFVGTARETVTRLLAGLQEEGLVRVGRGQISVPDVRRLRDVARG